jgi:hypothetical protein
VRPDPKLYNEKPSLCHIENRVEPYRAQSGLTQCHKCQQLGQVWTNCKQHPHCLWFGGGHLHKECPEKGNTSSMPKCCHCRLVEGTKRHAANYRGCRKRSHRGHPGLQREGCSLPTSPLQACPSWRCSEAGQRNSSGLRHIRWKWQVPPQWNPGSLLPYSNTSSRQQVSQLITLM